MIVFSLCGQANKLFRLRTQAFVVETTTIFTLLDSVFSLLVHYVLPKIPCGLLTLHCFYSIRTLFNKYLAPYLSSFSLVTIFFPAQQ